MTKKAEDTSPFELVEFDRLPAMAGIMIAEDRNAKVLAGHAGQRRFAGLAHAAGAAFDEPANLHDLMRIFEGS